MGKSRTKREDGSHSITYGDPMRDERLVVRVVYQREGFILIEDEATGESLTVNRRIAETLARAIKGFQL
jgi:hypothetical protein